MVLKVSLLFIIFFIVFQSGWLFTVDQIYVFQNAGVDALCIIFVLTSPKTLGYL